MSQEARMTDPIEVDYVQLVADIDSFVHTYPTAPQGATDEAKKMHRLTHEATKAVHLLLTELGNITEEAEEATKEWQKKVSELGRENQDLETQVKSLQAERANLQAQVTQANQATQAAEAALAAQIALPPPPAEPLAPPSPPPRRTNRFLQGFISAPESRTEKSEKLPDREKYHGNRKGLPQFQNMLKLKLLGNADRYPTLQNQLTYAISRLEGPAADQFMPYIPTTGINLPFIERFFEVLNTAFGDPDQEGTAGRALRRIRQNNRPFFEYFQVAEFQRYTAEARMGEVTNVEALMEGLSEELTKLMVHEETPATVLELAIILQRLDNKQQMITARYRPHYQASAPLARPTARYVAPAPPAPRYQASAPPAPRYQAPVRPNPPAAAHPSHTPGGAVPMNLSTGRGRLDPQEREARRAESRCFYCGGVGHLVRECPQAPALRNPASRIRGAKVDMRSEEKEEASGDEALKYFSLD